MSAVEPARPRRVLEISGEEGAAAWCGQLFVRAGFEVTKAEPARRTSPDPAADLFLNTGKARVRAELGSADLAELAAGHDLVITDASSADTRRHGLLDLPAAVVVSITPFGLDGPYADWAATDATLLALGGHTFLSGDAGRAPLTMPGRYPAYQAGNFAFVAAGASLLASAPARIEISVLECLATLHQFTDTMWTEDGIIRTRHGNRWANLHPLTLLPAPDGWVLINVTPNFWTQFTKMIGREDLAGDHPWSVSENRVRDADEIDQVIMAAIGTWPKERVFLEGQASRSSFPAVPTGSSPMPARPARWPLPPRAPIGPGRRCAGSGSSTCPMSGPGRSARGCSPTSAPTSSRWKPSTGAPERRNPATGPGRRSHRACSRGTASRSPTS
jgi:crotonobetainyl-CoA:carnitine CoA-transferase CaiB-like acyl-CoA transferase